MSRYAHRGLAPPTSGRSRTPSPRVAAGYEGYGFRDPEPGLGMAHDPADRDYDDDDDDTTAVATDLSGLKPPAHERRGVAFGPNEVETFHGSEAPEAVQPAPSTRQLGERLPSVSVCRPRSNSIDGRRREAPVLPPPRPLPRYVISDQRLRDATPEGDLQRNHPNRRSVVMTAPPPRDYTYGSYGYGQPEDEDMIMDDRYPDDDEDTAVGTGVASELDMDHAPMDSRGQRDRSPILPSREPVSSFHAGQRPPSRGVFVRRSLLPAPPPPPARPTYYADYPCSQARSGYESSDVDYPDVEPPAGLLLRQNDSPYGYRSGEHSERERIPRSPSRTQGRAPLDDAPRVVEPYVRQPAPRQDSTEDSPLEKELIELLKQLKFSVALKDFHDAMKIGVQKTLVAEDGRGHAYCKVHCKRLPRQEDLVRESHLRNHWIPLTGSHWQFRTASHSVTVVFKTAALAAYEAQFLTGRR